MRGEVGLGLGCRDWGCRFRVVGLGSYIGHEVQGSGFRVQGWGLGFGVSGCLCGDEVEACMYVCVCVCVYVCVCACVAMKSKRGMRSKAALTDVHTRVSFVQARAFVRA